VDAPRAVLVHHADRRLGADLLAAHAAGVEHERVAAAPGLEVAELDLLAGGHQLLQRIAGVATHAGAVHRLGLLRVARVDRRDELLARTPPRLCAGITTGLGGRR